MTIEPKQFCSLVDLIGQIETLHQRLVGVLRSKIDAMKVGEFQRMRCLEEEEGTLVEQVRERDGLRRQLFEAIGRTAGDTECDYRNLPVKKLASKLAMPQRLELLDAAHSLKAAMVDLSRINQIVNAIARGVLDNLRIVFESVRAGAGEKDSYSGKGNPISRQVTGMLDAVG